MRSLIWTMCIVHFFVPWVILRCQYASKSFIQDNHVDEARIYLICINLINNKQQGDRCYNKEKAGNDKTKLR